MMANGGIEKRADDMLAKPSDAEAEVGEALRLARHVNDLLARAAVVSNARNVHSVRIAQAISESLVDELEGITGRTRRRHVT